MCVITVKYQCGGFRTALHPRCECTTAKAVSSATPWCHEYDCYQCRARFEGVPAAEGAIYDGLPYDEHDGFDESDEPHQEDDRHVSPFEDRHLYTATDDATNIAIAQTVYDRGSAGAARYRHKQTVQLREFAKQLAIPNKDLDKVAGLAFLWLDEAQWMDNVGRAGCCWWHEKSLPAVSVLAAAADLHVPITLSIADVTNLIQYTEDDLKENLCGCHCFDSVRECWKDIGTHALDEPFLETPLHELAQNAANRLEECRVRIELERCYAERPLWWFSDLRGRTYDLTGDLTKWLPVFATRRPYPGADAGMWELKQPGAE